MNPKTLERWDKRYVWHPFTQQREWNRAKPVIIERGEGNYLIDVNGRRYLDGVSSLWCNVHGHRVPAIDRAVRRQLGKIAHTTFLGLSHVPAIELAKRLVDIAPRGLTKVFYSDSGSAAVEVAIKMAFQYWVMKNGRVGATRRVAPTFIKLKNAYHGDTLGSVSVGGIKLFHDIFHPLMFKTFMADAPYRYRDDFEGSESEYAGYCADKVERILKRHHRRIAALIVEPLMQGAAGMLVQPKGYLSRLRALTKKYGVLLIADEVATGFGRTGRMFACEHERVTPDFLCLGKGITGGYLPLSATLTTKRVYDAFLGEYADFKAFFHGHTYSANPLACAAANASLDLFKKNRVIKKLQPKIKLLSEELGQIASLAPVGDIRQKGFMAGIELVGGKRPAHRVCAEAIRRGVWLRPLGNVVVLMPPLSITMDELRFLCQTVRDAIIR